MSKYYLVSIPVKNHLQKFFFAQEGYPIKATGRSLFWLIIRPYLLYKMRDDHSVAWRKKKMEKLTGKLIVSIPMSKVSLYGLYVRPDSILLINQVLSYLFGQALYTHMIRYEVQPGRYKGYKEGIDDFCKKYQIDLEEDISTESLLRIFQRHKNYIRSPHLQSV